ncbi:MAG: IS21 family transposase [Deltaproteobacteria bacterium]|jgi:transposase|nr:IS21 family transposase [Deltaproteobacteria bacterium]
MLSDGADRFCGFFLLPAFLCFGLNIKNWRGGDLRLLLLQFPLDCAQDVSLTSRRGLPVGPFDDTRQPGDFDTLIWPHPGKPKSCTFIKPDYLAGREVRLNRRRRKVELFEEIRREYEHGVGTIRAVARKLGVHRRMVREALASAVAGERKIAVREKPRLGPAITFINTILEADQKAPRKQRHTAHRIWGRICDELPDLKVSEPTVRRYVRQRKHEMGLIGREIFIPQSYRFGDEAQVDWYEAYADLDEERQKLFIFCMRSMASGGAFHRAYPHASQQAFLEAHEFGFHYFGGVFATLRYDNLSSAVKKILRGHQREETERFIAFRSHWGFQSDFCNPGRGNEKGGVEGEGGYFRRNHLVPVPEAGSLEDLNRQLLEASREDERRVISGRQTSIGEAMRLEREHLLPLVQEGFQLAAIHFPMVNTHGMVKVLTNFYSAPLPVGVEVQTKVYPAHVEIWHQGKCVARHERSYGRSEKVLNLEHYLEVLLKKPGALAGSTPLEQWRAKGRWPQSYDKLWKILKERHGKQDGTRAMIEIIILGRKHGYPELEQAVSQALDLGCYDVSAVSLLLHTDRESPKAQQPVEIGALSRYDRPQPHLGEYDQLLSNFSGEVMQ